ncbi:winged helix-turn-helix domain-containing protein [Kitasatospora sp. NE20-6]|uniref:winged helix-turn-helix domain-containing protein n=1 Tax=Kitasatospora sp. NE20-6 TaxID=2859066 RepID=UPI0038B3827C
MTAGRPGDHRHRRRPPTSHQRDPAHRRVADDLRRRLAAGEWTPSTRLPSRARLATEYQVGPSVLQQAREQLIREGLVEGRAGSGTYDQPPDTAARCTWTPGPRRSTSTPRRPTPCCAQLTSPPSSPHPPTHLTPGALPCRGCRSATWRS